MVNGSIFRKQLNWPGSIEGRGLKIKREYTIALLVLLGAGLLTFGVYFLKGIDIFEKPNVFHVEYVDVSGINESTPVFYNGYKVGQVIRTDLVPETRRIRVSFQLSEERLRLPRGTRVRIYSADLFSRALQLELGAGPDEHVPGDLLEGDSQMSLTDAVSEQMDPLKRKAEAMLASIDSVLSSLQLILNDTARRDIDASFASIRSTLEALDHSAQQIDDMLSEKVSTIRNIIDNLARVTETLADQNGTLARIFANLDSVTTTLSNGDLDRTMADLSVASAQLKELMAGLEAGEGTAGKLLKNDSLYHNLESASSELDLLLEDLRLNPNRYFSVFGKKDRLPRLSNSDVDRIKRSLEEDKRMQAP